MLATDARDDDGPEVGVQSSSSVGCGLTSECRLRPGCDATRVRLWLPFVVCDPSERWSKEGPGERLKLVRVDAGDLLGTSGDLGVMGKSEGEAANCEVDWEGGVKGGVVSGLALSKSTKGVTSSPLR